MVYILHGILLLLTRSKCQLLISTYFTPHLVQRSPFSVTPSEGVLPSGESMQISIDYQSDKVGTQNGFLVVGLSTHEDLHVKVIEFRCLKTVTTVNES